MLELVRLVNAPVRMLQQVNVLEPLLLVPSLARLNLSLQCVLLGSSSRGGRASDAILDRIGRVIREGGIEAGQEAAAGVAQNLIEKGIYNPERGAFEGTGEAAACGGGVGAFVQGIVELAARARTRGDTPKVTPPK